MTTRVSHSSVKIPGVATKHIYNVIVPCVCGHTYIHKCIKYTIITISIIFSCFSFFKQSTIILCAWNFPTSDLFTKVILRYLRKKIDWSFVSIVRFLTGETGDQRGQRHMYHLPAKMNTGEGKEYLGRGNPTTASGSMAGLTWPETKPTDTKAKKHLLWCSVKMEGPLLNSCTLCACVCWHIQGGTIVSWIWWEIPPFKLQLYNLLAYVPIILRVIYLVVRTFQIPTIEVRLVFCST